MRVLVFGDSIAQGFWDTEGGWVARLRKHYDILQVKDLNKEQPTVINLGISGDKSDSILKRLKVETKARTWPGEEFLFIFAVGANNSYKKHGKYYSTPEQFRNDLEKIIKISKEFSGKIMFVGLAACEEHRTTPVWWDDVVWTNKRIFEFDKTLRKVCEMNNTLYVPVYGVFQKEMAEGHELFIDGVHPNNAGHELIFQFVRPELDKLLAK